MVKEGSRIGADEISNSNSSKPSTGIESTESEKSGVGVGGGDRVWTMQDLYKHPMSRGYSRGLYNFAWAQAVQKKPLNEAVLSNAAAELGNGEAVNLENGEGVVVQESGKEAIGDGGDQNVTDLVEEECGSEKEEGELEEGEIDLDSDGNPVEVVASVKEVEEEDVDGGSDDGVVDMDCGQIDESEFDDRFLAILEALESVTTTEAENAFEGVCSQLLDTLKSLRELVRAVPSVDALVQLFLTALSTVHTVFCSMNQDQREQHKETFSRLLTQIKKQKPPLFSPKQMKDIEDMMLSFANPVKEISHAADLSKKLLCDSLAVGYSSNNDGMSLPEYPSISTSRSRGMAPLLDLHKDHDVDSLPSPTSRSTPNFAIHRNSPSGNVVHSISGVGPARATPGSKTHPFGTEALKAFSSYQQTFGSFERLPSPTPSEEDEKNDTDCGTEVSSLLAPLDDVKPPVSLGHHAPSVPSLNHDPRLRPSTAPTTGTFSSGTSILSNPVRSRDPRLRYAGMDASSLDLKQQQLVNAAPTPDIIGGPMGVKSKVNRNVVEFGVDGPAAKRQKNGISNSVYVKDLKANTSTGSWLDDTGTAGTMLPNKNPTRKMGGNLRDPRSGLSGYANSTVGPCGEIMPLTNNLSNPLLPDLLKNIVVNPSILFELLKSGNQQNLIAEAQQMKNSPTVQTRNTVGVMAEGLVNGTSIKPTAVKHRPAGTLHGGDQGIIQMKPRDPRRRLHSLTGSKEKVNVPVPESHASLKSLSRQVVTPDISSKITENVKNNDNVMASFPMENASPIASHSQPVSFTTDEQKTDTESATGDAVADPSKPQTNWNDVEHLFDGYDDQERAAIQKERTRRLDEQKKMFAERKLCLVLDLDHTLLNSAKFGEIDLAHEEMLRKKEEQDRGKPYRHLFRFPHMGMWTKLRPGIWNFLEKASKLYELHLYTMGNKLYASEMAKILDPKGVLFSGRVIAKGDDGDTVDGDDRIPKTKDLEGVLGMESSVVIIDDSIIVWPHNKMNLIVVERYIYFPCSRRQFGLPGPSLLEIDHDERAEDGTLASSLAVIERLHRNFFSHQDLNEVDVRNILASEQRKILSGCRIVFSRVFPVGEASPHLHPLWQTAEQFGATCTTNIDENVTHVVANSLGTDKVNWAIQAKKFVVHPNWVEACGLLYRRVNELDFAIKP